MQAYVAAAAAAICLMLAGCSTAPGRAPADAGETASSGVPEAQAAQIRAAGQSMDPTLGSIFADLVDAPPYDDVDVARDEAYGSDPRQVLDVYTPKDGGGAARPVLVFVHGGGFVGGSKSGDFYPDNIGAWAARNGMIGVHIEYRLAPAAPWPAGRDDLAAALTWVRANIAEMGGDAQQVILWGHSAGANHVADYVQHSELHGPEFGSVQGAILLSPNYSPEAPAQPSPYYGSTADLQTEGPAIERLGASDVPIFLAYAEYDPDPFKEFARQAEQTLCEGPGEGKCPRVVYLRDHNHFTEGTSVGSSDRSLTGPLLEWMRGLD